LIWLWCVVVKLKTLKNGWPAERLRQWAVWLESSQIAGSLKL